jgi:pimeloyl-ACP methyl ester carboxylesterase
VPLPSCGETGDELGDLHADLDACREAVSAAEGPVVLCGHSYGGMVITEAGADDRVTQLLYVTSVMPDAGQSQAELIGSEPAPWLQPGEDGTVGVDPDMIPEFFLQDCDESTTEQALDRLTRQSLTPFTHPPRQIAWQQKPASTSSAPRISLPQPTSSADASRMRRDSSSSRPGITRSSHAPTNSRKAWSPRSITTSRKTVGIWFVATAATDHRLLLQAWSSHARAGSRRPTQTCLRCRTGISSATPRALLRADGRDSCSIHLESVRYRLGGRRRTTLECVRYS